jgi:hypothetical protein
VPIPRGPSDQNSPLVNLPRVKWKLRDTSRKSPGLSDPSPVPVDRPIKRAKCQFTTCEVEAPRNFEKVLWTVRSEPSPRGSIRHVLEASRIVLKHKQNPT